MKQTRDVSGRAPRGPNGVVRGLKAKRATKAVCAGVDHVGNLGTGGVFGLAEMRLFFRESGFAKNKGQATGLVVAMQRLPGTTRVGQNQHRLHPNAKHWAEHREWRFSTRKLNLEEAEYLSRALRVRAFSVQPPGRVGVMMEELSGTLPE